MQATLKSQLQAGVEIFNPLKPNLTQTFYTLGSIRRMWKSLSLGGECHKL